MSAAPQTSTFTKTEYTLKKQREEEEEEKKSPVTSKVVFSFCCCQIVSVTCGFLF